MSLGEVCPQRVEVRRGVAKMGRKWRNFGGAGAIAYRFVARQMKIFHRIVNGEMSV